MYVGVDIGGTKTLLAVLDEHGVIKQKVRFPTPGDYHHFLLELRHAAAHLDYHDFKAGGVGAAGLIDRKHGRRSASGKLAWQNAPLQADAEKIFDCPIVLENDAKMAALSEAMLLKDDYNRVLYVTIGTGIGYALVVDCVIDTMLGDRGGTNIFVEHRGKHISYESLVSGRAIVERFGRRGEDIDDAATWKIIARDISKGLVELISITEPQVIVFGGGVGAHFGRFGDPLEAELSRYHLPLIKLPALKKAKRPEEAVVYGCYDLAKQTYPHAKAHR